jgi:hypothetical protein
VLVSAVGAGSVDCSTVAVLVSAVGAGSVDCSTVAVLVSAVGAGSTDSSTVAVLAVVSAVWSTVEVATSVVWSTVDAAASVDVETASVGLDSANAVGCDSPKLMAARAHASTRRPPRVICRRMTFLPLEHQDPA